MNTWAESVRNQIYACVCVCMCVWTCTYLYIHAHEYAISDPGKKNRKKSPNPTHTQCECVWVSVCVTLNLNPESGWALKKGGFLFFLVWNRVCKNSNLSVCVRVFMYMFDAEKLRKKNQTCLLIELFNFFQTK